MSLFPKMPPNDSPSVDVLISQESSKSLHPSAHHVAPRQSARLWVNRSHMCLFAQSRLQVGFTSRTRLPRVLPSTRKLHARARHATPRAELQLLQYNILPVLSIFWPTYLSFPGIKVESQHVNSGKCGKYYVYWYWFSGHSWNTTKETFNWICDGFSRLLKQKGTSLVYLCCSYKKNI